MISSGFLVKPRPAPLRLKSEPNADIFRGPHRLPLVGGYHEPAAEIATGQLNALSIDSQASPAPVDSGLDVGMELSPTDVSMEAKASHISTHDMIGPPSPPNTPPTHRHSNLSSRVSGRLPLVQSALSFIFDIDDGELIGSGLWSKVYRFDAVPTVPCETLPNVLTPPSTPCKAQTPRSAQAYAVKVAIRKDAVEVFQHEAAVLRHLQQDVGASDHIMPFHGFALSGTALVFQAAEYGTLESLISTQLPTFSTMTSIFSQLVSGLEFLHLANVIHADIKPANILLDISGLHVIQARYCDFSASLVRDPLATDGEVARASAMTGGGTWDYMAPEQISSDKSTNGPSFETDVWSLAITLLTLVLGSSPYEPMRNNVFMLREAVKMGQPVAFAQREPDMATRLESIDHVLIEGLGLALKKRKETRVSASKWKKWVLDSRNMV